MKHSRVCETRKTLGVVVRTWLANLPGDICVYTFEDKYAFEYTFEEVITINRGGDFYCLFKDEKKN